MDKMPVVFVGHGSPMNALEDNVFTRGWKQIASVIPTPTAILAISAHWFVTGTRILNDPKPQMTYDMYGFPQELYQVVYSAPGATAAAARTAGLLADAQINVQVDNSWGFDHGTWSVLVHMYPEHKVPVFQLSIDGSAPAAAHFKMGQALSALREEGVLILGSGNIVHNLRMIDWSRPEGGFDWADAYDQYVQKQILDKAFDKLVSYESAGREAQLSVPTPDHYFPLLYVLGACNGQDTATVYNDARVMGSMSMTSYLFAAR